MTPKAYVMTQFTFESSEFGAWSDKIPGTTGIRVVLCRSRRVSRRGQERSRRSGELILGQLKAGYSHIAPHLSKETGSTS